MNARTITTTFVTLSVLITASLASAQVVGSGFDGMPVGPYSGAGTVLQGNPAVVQVVDVASVGSAAPPGAFGNVLCIDNRNQNAVLIFRFNYTCGGLIPDAICKINYDFWYSSWAIGSYVGVYTDDEGSYTNPDDWFQPPVGFPPSTSWGNNSETEQSCTAGHTIDFVVSPGCLIYLDNFTTECLPPVSNEEKTWGAVKGLYR